MILGIMRVCYSQQTWASVEVRGEALQGKGKKFLAPSFPEKHAQLHGGLTS